MFDRIVKIQQTNYFYIETIVALTVIVLINYFFLPLQPAFADVNPNPLWIVVLGISARYGRSGAIFAGAMTAAVFVGYNVIFANIDIFYDDPWLLRYPFLFALIGFMIGEVKSSFILREDYLSNRVQELEDLTDRLMKEMDIVRLANRDLSTNVATQQSTITSLNEITSHFKSLNIADIQQGILYSANVILEAEECSFYALDGDELILKTKLGWKDYYKRPEKFKLGQGMVGVCAQKKEILTIKDVVLGKKKGKEFDIMGDSVLVLPVIDFADNVYGVLSIEKISLTKLTDATIQTAKIISELAASSLATAYAFAKIKSENISDEKLGIYKYHYFKTRLNEEFLRSSNYMFPLSVIAFKWPGISNLKPEKLDIFMQSIIKILRTNLRAFDLVATGPNKDTPLVMLLATTSRQEAEAMRKKIVKKISEYELDKMVLIKDLEGSVIVNSFDPNRDKSADDLLKQLNI